MKPELLAPVGSMSKLHTALHFGADAVYLGGSNFGLRAFADNFNDQQLKEAIELAHSMGKKVYVTVNIFARDEDFAALADYFKLLAQLGADACIIGDLGVMALCRKVAPSLAVHVSTQANITNSYAIDILRELGAQRVVLARELTLDDIRSMRDRLPPETELEAFVHGAMCVSYSGRCLLSNFLSGRSGNRGECVQACRWEYSLTEKSRPNCALTLSEDSNGSYIMNSKDLNMLSHLDKLLQIGVLSYKIEGRMKSSYYVANVVNAYRRALDGLCSKQALDMDMLNEELYKTANRGYTTGFYFGKQNDTINYESSAATAGSDFIAEVLGYDEAKRCIILEQRNRFRDGDELEILSSGESFNKKLTVRGLTDETGNSVLDAKLVQQKLYLPSDIRLQRYDILRSCK